MVTLSRVEPFYTDANTMEPPLFFILNPYCRELYVLIKDTTKES